MIKRILSILIIFVLLFIPSNAYASIPSYNLKFQPANLVLKSTQGSNFKQDIHLENQSDTISVPVALYVMNFKAEDGGKQVYFYTPSDSRQDLSRWIKPEIANFVIKPKQKIYATFDFNIPDYAKDGTYSGIIFIESRYGANSYDSGSSLNIRGGINVLLNVSKNDSEYSSLYKYPKLENFNIPFFSLNDVSYSGKIKNDGPFATSSDVNIDVYNIFGQKVRYNSFSDIDVLPGNFRYLDGNSKVLFIKGLNLGFYKLDISLKDNLKNKTFIKEYYFTVVPIYSIIIFILMLSIIYTSIYVIRRKKKNKYVKY